MRQILPSTKTNGYPTTLNCNVVFLNFLPFWESCALLKKPMCRRSLADQHHNADTFLFLTASEVCSPVRGPRRDSESDRDDFLLRGHSRNVWHHVSCLLERTLICHSINDTSAGSKNVVLQHSHLMNRIRGSQCVRPCSSLAWRRWIPSLCQRSRKHLILIIGPVSPSCDGLLSPLDETTPWREVCPVFFYQFSWSCNFGAKSLSQMKQK